MYLGMKFSTSSNMPTLIFTKSKVEAVNIDFFITELQQIKKFVSPSPTVNKTERERKHKTPLGQAG